MNAGHYADPSINYEQAAQAWAIHLDQPFNGGLDFQLLEALFTGIYPETIEFIEVDPPAFSRRVAEYRYGEAMKHNPEN